MPTALPSPTDGTVHRLQAAQGDPLVSGLCTSPAATLEPADAATLRTIVSPP
jgi:hypothetical protein